MAHRRICTQPLKISTSLGIVMVEPNPQIDLTVDGMTIDEIPEGSSID
jgi:hypothetical protein